MEGEPVDLKGDFKKFKKSMGKSKLLYQAINIWELKHKDMQGNYYSEVKIVLIIIGMRHMEASWGISNILFVDLGGDFSCFHLMIIP